MKKYRILSFVLIFVLLSALFVIPANAASASASISVSASSFYVGNTVNVTVRYTSSEAIGSWDFNIAYDPSVLQYVSGADTGGGGTLRVVGYSSSTTGQTSVSCTIVFKAIAIGNCNISTTPSLIVDWNSMERMAVSGATRTVKVVAPPRASTDNVLSALTVAPGELVPAFSAETLSYSLSVPFETNELVVSATPRDAKARVSVSSPALSVGENTVNVTVTAESGATRVYSIQVTRLQSAYADVNTTIGGVDYTFGYDPTSITPPEGFTVSSSTYGEKEILAYASALGSVKLVWLMNGEIGAWYVYNEKDQSFSEFVSVPQTEKNYVILPVSSDVSIPEGYTETILEREESKLTVFKGEKSEENGIYLIYALSPDGNVGFYFFDSVHNDFLKFDSSLIPDPVDEEALQASADLQQELQEVNKKADFWEILTLSVGLVAAVFLVVIVILSFLLSKKASALSSAETAERGDTLPMADPNEPLMLTEEDAKDYIEENSLDPSALTNPNEAEQRPKE